MRGRKPSPSAPPRREAGKTPHPSPFGRHLLPQGEKDAACYAPALLAHRVSRFSAAPSMLWPCFPWLENRAPARTDGAPLSTGLIRRPLQLDGVALRIT